MIPGFLILSVFGIISWLLANHGSNFHQIIMDSISRPLASMGSVVGWAYVIFNSLLWFFGVHGSLALTALDNGINLAYLVKAPKEYWEERRERISRYPSSLWIAEISR